MMIFFLHFTLFQEDDQFKRRVLAESFRSNIQTVPPGGLYTANRAKQRSGNSPGRDASSPTGPIPRRASTPNRSAPGTPSRKRRSMKIANDVMKQVMSRDRSHRDIGALHLVLTPKTLLKYLEAFY